MSSAAKSVSSVSTASINSSPAPAVSLDGAPLSFNGTPIALYTIVARGANKCWLGPTRALHDSHVFRATVSSDAKKAAPSIVIYERDKTSKPEKRLAALRINIEAVSASQSSVTVINRRFAVPAAQLMLVDVQRWAGGKLTCTEAGAEQGANNLADANKPEPKTGKKP